MNDVTGVGTSSLSVTSNLVVQKGAALILGCVLTSFPCFDDPNQDNPTLSSLLRVGGALTSSQPLGVIAHGATIKGAVTETGGGGGLTCDPSGIFADFESPVYSAYEDNSIGGNVTISGLTSCWLGVIRNRISGFLQLVNNQLFDPDAIEVISNHITGSLSCSGNSMVWNSSDIGEDLFPRAPGPNTVGGARSGQCVLSSPTSEGGPLGPGPF